MSIINEMVWADSMLYDYTFCFRECVHCYKYEAVQT